MKKILLTLMCVLAVVAVAKPQKSLVGARGVGNSGENLPYDAEVEYLESTGTQWIDTEIVGDSTTTSDMVCMRTKDSSNDMALGCIGSGNTRAWLAFWFSKKYYIGYGSGDITEVAAPLNEIVNVVNSMPA